MKYLEFLKRIIANPDRNRWDYYRCHRRETLEGVFAFPSSFINSTFTCAQKEMLNNSNFGMGSSFNASRSISEQRAAHSVSSFFLGFLLANGLIGDDLMRFCSFENIAAEYPFSYVWNLTSLYHDFGYKYENDNSLKETIAGELAVHEKKLRGINSLKRELGVKHSIWSPGSFYRRKGGAKRLKGANCQDEKMYVASNNDIIDKYICDNSKYFRCNGRRVSIPSVSCGEADKYLRYRLRECEDHQCVDHGIAGGISFYDLIIKNYLHKYDEKKRCDENANIEEFTISNGLGRKLRAGLDQTVMFAYVADCIIRHNIWKADSKSEKIYERCGLEHLIGDAYKKINFYNNPLLFILCVSDTLEPYKNFHSVAFGKSIDSVEYSPKNAVQIFEKYDIEVMKDRIAIKVPSEWSQSLENKLDDMKNWLDIDYTRNGQEFILHIIKLP